MKLDLTVELKKFLDYLEIERGCSPYTLLNFKSHLTDFIQFLQGQDLTLESIRQYRTYLAGKQLTKASQNAYLIALRSFIKYLNRQDLLMIPLDRIELMKTPERQIKILTISQFEELLNQPQFLRKWGMRDRAILELLFATGLRVSELCKLNKNDINFEEGEFNVLGKGGKVRPIFVTKLAMKWVRRYLRKRRDGERPLFMSTHRKRVSPRVVQNLVKKYAQQAGLQGKVTPHVLRHLFASDLLAKGANLRAIQELLGHSNIATTQIYTHITNPQLKETYLRFHRRDL